MRYTCSFEKHILHFKKPAGTSRGYLTEKPAYFIHIKDSETAVDGIGECSILPGLSIDERPDIEDKLKEVCELLNQDQQLHVPENLEQWPAIVFGLETAILDVQHGGKRLLFDNAFSRGEKGILINGLVWMDNIEGMWQQVQEKIAAGFPCVKLKIGALDFASELNLLERIRDKYPDAEIRLDANGALRHDEALNKLQQLSEYHIHSIEQPVKQGQYELMAELCKASPIPIALDEELIGVTSREGKINLLDTIQPQYIILKPSLIGGFASADEWIALAEERNIGWWATSALESNIGLNAIAQWTASKNISLPQGLGTGSLFTNNIPMPMEIKKGELLLHL
jgi:o-succinylbenzoate synthase